MQTAAALSARDILYALFIGVWVLLGIIIYVLTHVKKDVEFNRRWVPRLAAFIGVVFIVFAAAGSVIDRRPWDGLGAIIVGGPAVGLIILMHISMTRFCGKCGAVIYDRSLFWPVRFCPWCGADLTPKP